MRVLRGRRMRLARPAVRHDRTVAERPHAWPPGHRERLVDDDAAAIQGAGQIVR